MSQDPAQPANTPPPQRPGPPDRTPMPDRAPSPEEQEPRPAGGPEVAHDVAERIEEIAPADAASVLADLPVEEAAEVAEYLDPDTAGRILAEMDPTAAAAIVQQMEPPEASMVVASMHPDDRVDVLEQVERPLHEELISEMPPADAANIRSLEQHPPDTAGGIMTTEVAALREDLTAEQAIAEIRRMADQVEQLLYVYVIDARGHLIGVLSMRDLILAGPGRLLRQVMNPDVVSVPVTMDQEDVARIMRKYNYLALPVVDSRNRLAGVITIDDVVDVLEEESTEDVQRMFGAGAEERLTSPWQFSFRRRIGWLQVNLLTAFLAASVVGFFQSTIEKMAILAMYMPIVAGMGGNASAQAMAVAIRGIALGQAHWRELRRVLYRELIVGLLSGIVCGLSTVLITAVLRLPHGILVGAIAAVALAINHVMACLAGAGIPFVMKRLGFDPAQSATIFATTLTDMVGFFTLLGLASLAMPWLR